MPLGRRTQRSKISLENILVWLPRREKKWRLGCGGRRRWGRETLDEEGQGSGKGLSPGASTKRAAPVSCLYAGLRVGSQHSGRLEKEEESVQNPCRSVKEGRLWAGTQRGGECGGYSTSRIWGVSFLLQTHLYTLCRAGKRRENGRACGRNGWLTCVRGEGGQKAHLKAGSGQENPDKGRDACTIRTCIPP